MAQTTTVQNPFMLMLHPEVVLAAMEGSERLNRLNRHLCRPLDRQVAQGSAGIEATPDDDSGDADAAIDGAA